MKLYIIDCDVMLVYPLARNNVVYVWKAIRFHHSYFETLSFLHSSFSTDACDLTMDPNTAHRHLSLSEGNRKVTWEKVEIRYPHHPDRFKFKEQVLCREPLSRRCYWEVCWSGEGVHIGVAYKRIKRQGQGEDCWLGHNDESWKLYCCRDSYTAWHCKKSIFKSIPCSTRIGVFLDWEGGTLSFYNISTDTNTLERLHTFYVAFQEPLYPGFRVLNSSAWLDCP